MNIRRIWLLALGLCLIASASPAQWIAHPTAVQNIGASTEWYGSYWYTAMACKGNLAVAAASVDALSQQVPSGYYLALLISSDGGENWTITGHGLPGPTWSHEPVIRRIDIVDGQHIVAIGDSGLMVRTTNGGATWERLTAPSTARLADLSFSDTSHGLLVAEDTANTTFTTSDGGVNWSVAPFSRATGVRCHDYGSGMYRICTMLDGRVYTTPDNWQTVDSTDPIITDTTARHYVYAECAFDGDTIVVCGYRNLQNQRKGLRPFIARSTNAGKSWTRAYDAYTTVLWNIGSAQYLSDISRDTIMAGLRGSKSNTILWSSNRGLSWQFDTLIVPDTVEAGNCFGVGLNSSGEMLGAYTISGIDGAMLILGTRKVEAVPRRYGDNSAVELYPNPAISTTSVRGLAPGALVRVQDVLGREILSAIVPNDGVLNLNVSALTPGCYYVDDGSRRSKFVKE